jgi:FAD/FMN-containing dehydrogenase
MTQSVTAFSAPEITEAVTGPGWGALAPRLLSDPARLERYEVPERGPRGHTRLALLPASEGEVGELLAECTARRQPVVISAGRTGLVEAQRPEGEAVLSLERLSKPIRLTLADGRSFSFESDAAADGQIDALAAWWQSLGKPPVVGASLEVEACVTVDAANALLAPLGLMWPMELGSSSAASVGGCIANGSAGANALCYGTAAQLAESVQGFWADGQPTGPIAARHWQQPAADRLAIDSTAVSAELGLIGSQGLFGVITRVRLRTYPIPAQREAAILPASGMPEAMRILAAARQVFGNAVEEFEFMGRRSIELVRDLKGDAFRWPLAEISAPYYLLLQIKADDAEIDLAGRLYGFLAETLALDERAIGYAPLPALKAIRHSITEASNLRMRRQGGGRLSFDTATPVDRFGDYLAALTREITTAAPGVEVITFGHAGVGGAHIHLIGSAEQPVAALADRLVAQVFDITARFGGTFSAEHGVGPKWGAAFQCRADPALRAWLAAEKKHRDPAGILNPRSFGLAGT